MSFGKEAVATDFSALCVCQLIQNRGENYATVFQVGVFLGFFGLFSASYGGCSLFSRGLLYP